MKRRDISLTRRFGIALCTLLVAAIAFHAQVASALVTRGDDAMRAGNQTLAIAFYRRAVTLDPAAQTPADRLAFNLLLRHTPDDAQSAIDIASGALRRHPDDVPLLVDRALGEQRLGHWKTAENDFARAGKIAKDPRYEHFAGRIALKRGHRAAAFRHFQAAVADDPRFAPARVALQSMRQRQ